MIYNILYFDKLKMGDIYKRSNKEFTIIASINHECGEGFALAIDEKGDLYIFCDLEGGYSEDFFNLSEVMRKTVLPPEMWEKIFDSIHRRKKMTETVIIFICGMFAGILVEFVISAVVIMKGDK